MTAHHSFVRWVREGLVFLRDRVSGGISILRYVDRSDVGTLTSSNFIRTSRAWR